MSTIDNLPTDVKSIVEKFLQLTKNRITKSTTVMLDIRFQIFCRKIVEPDRLIFLKAHIFGGTTNYTNPPSHTVFAKLLNDQDFTELMTCIKQAVREKNTLDNLRKEIKGNIDEDTFKTILLEELKSALLEINSGDTEQMALADFTQSKIQNLISESNRWQVDANRIILTIREAAMDPILFFDKDVSIFSIIEIVPSGQTVN